MPPLPLRRDGRASFRGFASRFASRYAEIRASRSQAEELPRHTPALSDIRGAEGR